MAEVGISRKGSADSVESLEGKMKVTAVTPAVAVQQSTPVLRDNYSTDGNLIKSRQNVIAALASDMREGGLGFQHVESEVDEVDVNTPDNWVPRSKHLIRLTGKHPFNCEPKIGILLDQGFFTPPSIHYIRNHGLALKEIEWESHSVSIGGLVANPLTLSMNELEAMPATSLPVTLVCAGNRRKEQNMTKQTIGFSWGPCAVGTHIWTGVRLRDLLLRAGIDMSRAKHVCFVGAEDLPNGKYGTSIPISLAMDAFGEVLIAYENNGMRLTPDHGYPVRVVIPGWIGGRMVKWLKDIIVTEEPSDNFYHFFDNRIMPPHVDAELAKKEGWWYKPEYLFNELNINSAIGSPDHDERLSLTSPNQEYTMRGYAYSGGGRKITRVEVSFDGGRVWELCNVDRPEEKFSHTTQYGRYYCWAFWTYKVQTKRFLETAMGSGELLCRAWDESNNTQPANLTWNLMGMGNNPHFRVKIHPETSLAGEFRLRFEHPTVAGPAKGGWMNPLDSEELAVNAESAKVTSAAATAAPTAKKVKDPSKKYFTWDEIKKHDNDDSAWIVVRDQVYDCTPFLKDHPGGGASITMNAGMDSTEDFDAIHSSKAQKMLEDYYIGELDDGNSFDVVTSSNPEEANNLIALNPKSKFSAKLLSKEILTSNTRRLRFGLQSPQHKFGLPVGYHVMLSGKVNGKTVMRAYSPVSCDDDIGVFELVIKVYRPCETFKNGGLFSQYLDRLSIGDTVDVKGPLGHFEYRGNGEVVLAGKTLSVKKLSFICGGTGITPAYQVIKKVLKSSLDSTEIFLVFANQSTRDILLWEELEQLESKYSNFHVYYTVTRISDEERAGWKYGLGYVNDAIVRSFLPAPESDGSLVGMCGPPSMLKTCYPSLNAYGFTSEQIFEF